MMTELAASDGALFSIYFSILHLVLHRFSTKTREIVAPSSTVCGDLQVEDPVDKKGNDGGWMNPTLLILPITSDPSV